MNMPITEETRHMQLIRSTGRHESSLITLFLGGFGGYYFNSDEDESFRQKCNLTLFYGLYLDQQVIKCALTNKADSVEKWIESISLGSDVTRVGFSVVRDESDQIKAIAICLDENVLVFTGNHSQDRNCQPIRNLLAHLYLVGFGVNNVSAELQADWRISPRIKTLPDFGCNSVVELALSLGIKELLPSQKLFAI